MNKYEALFILEPTVEEEVKNSIVERFKGVIEADGSITEVDEWGNRKLAYLIRDFSEGFYVKMNFEAKSEVVDELNRLSRITEQVMRNLVVRDEK